MRNRIALITPWPPQQTGIADYAMDLAVGLAKHGQDVEIFTSAEDPLTAGERVWVRKLEDFQGPERYDHVVYQMGNCSDFHIDQLPLLAEHGGIIHLHDLTLHHLLAFILYRGDCRDYYRLVQRWYGRELTEKVKLLNNSGVLGAFDTEFISQMPFFEPVVNLAKGCLVHSEHAKAAVVDRFPSLPVVKLPQVYLGMQPEEPRAARQKIKVGVFGIVQSHKHVDKVIQSLGDLSNEGQGFELHIAGSIEERCNDIVGLVDELGVESDVVFHGRVTSEKFMELMRHVDICVSLRYPTMGETSAVVSRALQLGLPTIVNDIGWYAELPKCVVKIPTTLDLMQSALSSQLSQVCADFEKLSAWRAQCQEYARHYLSFDSVIESYLLALNAMRQFDERSPSTQRKPSAVLG